jgi:hypothetical protein
LEKAIQKNCPGFHLPSNSDYHGNWIEFHKPGVAPFVALGDFNGDGRDEILVSARTRIGAGPLFPGREGGAVEQALAEVLADGAADVSLGVLLAPHASRSPVWIARLAGRVDGADLVVERAGGDLARFDLARVAAALAAPLSGVALRTFPPSEVTLAVPASDQARVLAVASAFTGLACTATGEAVRCVASIEEPDATSRLVLALGAEALAPR